MSVVCRLVTNKKLRDRYCAVKKLPGNCPDFRDHTVGILAIAGCSEHNSRKCIPSWTEYQLIRQLTVFETGIPWLVRGFVKRIIHGTKRWGRPVMLFDCKQLRYEALLQPPCLAQSSDHISRTQRALYDRCWNRPETYVPQDDLSPV